MTRRNDKRNNRRNRQRNNNPELPPFAQMLFGAIVGKGVDMIAKKMAEIAEQETPDIHAKGISNQDVTNINNGKASLTKCTIPTDGTAVGLPIPDNLQVFISEDGNPITYDDICKKLFLDMIAYKKSVKCTTPEQVKCMTAFNKLQNIAKYLNKGWKPNFKDATQKWFIAEQYFGVYEAKFTCSFNFGIVYFKSKELAFEAIRLMGEESLNDLFSTDW